MKVRVTLEYDYEGDEKTVAAALASEEQALRAGDVGLPDILDDVRATLKVEGIGEFEAIDEDVD